MSFNHAMITVSDLKRSQAFYSLLGARVVNDVGHYSRLAFANGNSLSLHHGAPMPGTTALYFEMDVDATHATLVAGGYRCTTPPVLQMWNWREACFDDPDGHPIVIYRDTELNRRAR